jgi:hypothetical protein
MCSIPGEPPASPGGTGQPGGLDSSGAVTRLERAIDELAEAARAPDGAAQDVTARLARVWEMVAELDPELARRLPGYGS